MIRHRISLHSSSKAAPVHTVALRERLLAIRFGDVDAAAKFERGI